MIVRILLNPGVLVRVLLRIALVLVFMGMNVLVRMAVFATFMFMLVFMLMRMFVRMIHIAS